MREVCGRKNVHLQYITSLLVQKHKDQLFGQNASAPLWICGDVEPQLDTESLFGLALAGAEDDGDE